MLLTTTFVAAYLLVACVLAPMFWREATGRQPALGGAPHVTHTMNGIHGDPVNLALIGRTDSTKSWTGATAVGIRGTPTAVSPW